MAETYRSVLVGLTGIGSNRPAQPTDIPLYGRMPPSHAAAYHQHPQTELVGVCDLRPEALDQFQSDWGDVWPDASAYTDFKKMLQEQSPDLVSIATSDHAHAELCVLAAEAGARAILCEKPIATTLADADRMIEACAHHKIPLSIEHTRRWDPNFQEARRVLRSGELGPLRTIVVEMFSERAMLFRNGTHLVDLIPFFAEADTKWLVAELEEGFEEYLEYSGDGGRNPDLEPYASAYLHLENGVRAFFNSYKTKFPGSQVTLTCEDGRIEVSDRGGRIIRGISHSAWSSSELQTGSYRCERQLAAIHELIQVLEHPGTSLVSSGQEARKTLEIILAMLASNGADNSRVNLPLG
jgi:UDP-N-acetylglucosamine 3-dehydrogenase